MHRVGRHIHFDCRRQRFQRRLEGAPRRVQAQAEEDAAHHKGLLDGKDQEIERLTSELKQARAERVDVSNRIESLLEQIDAVGGP